jgi:chemotaxis protein MotB
MQYRRARRKFDDEPENHERWRHFITPLRCRFAVKEKNEMTKLAQDLLSTLAPLVKEGKVRVTQNSRGVSVEINASVLFDPGDARLMPESVEALRAVRAAATPQCAGGRAYRQPADPQHALPVQLGTVGRARQQRGAPVHRRGCAAERLTAVGYSSNVPVAPTTRRKACAQPPRGGDHLSGIPEPSRKFRPACRICRKP